MPGLEGSPDARSSRRVSTTSSSDHSSDAPSNLSLGPDDDLERRSDGGEQPGSTGSRRIPLGRRLSLKNGASTTPASTPPGAAGTFLTRFISSFRPPTPTGDSRPSISRSLSTPGSPANLVLPGAKVNTSPVSSGSKFRPSFRRRATTGSPTSSPPTTPSTAEPSPGWSRAAAEVDPMESASLAEMLARQTTSAGNQYGVPMVKRGSVTSQSTMLPGSGGHAPVTSPALPSPLGMFAGSNSHPRRRPIEDPLALITTLLPAALLLLSQLGPAHLFSPPLALPLFDSAFKTASGGIPGTSVPLSDDRASVASCATTSTLSLPFNPAAFSPVHSYSHELHAPSTISVPAVSVAAVWRLFSGFEWIAEHDKIEARQGSSSDDGEEDALVFDFPSILQGVADVLAVSAARRGVELVIGQVGSGSAPSPISSPGVNVGEPSDVGVEKQASRELLVQADERAWSVVLIWIVHHVLEAATPGATVEVRFLAALAPGPSKQNLEASLGSQETAVPTRRSLQRLWTVSLDIILTSSTRTSRSPYDTTPSIPPIPPFAGSFAKSLFSQVELSIEGSPAAEDGSQSWTLTTVLAGARIPIVDPDHSQSTILGRRRASLGTTGNEPSIDDLKRFAETGLKGIKVALHAGEQSTFAKHLTTYLAGWGMDVSHVPLESTEGSDAGSVSGSVQGETVWNKGRREPARFDSGFGGSLATDGASPTSPFVSDPLTYGQREANVPSSPSGSSTGTDPPYNVLIIDDDVATLRRLLLALRAPPLHYAPTLMSKRPQLATRRTRSSPHVRQVHQLPPVAAGWAIIHFASLTHYKAIKEIVQDALANSRSPSLPDILVIPKPAGPRRIITALWTAFKRPAVDPSLPPIATSPTSPGIQYWTPRLSPALANQQDFDSAAAEALAKADLSVPGSSKPRTPPVYFPGQPIGHPPSPLGKISDDQVSYFSCVAENMDGTTPSEGMVIQSPNGRPAIFFQPQTRGARAATAKGTSRPMERDREMPEDQLDANDSASRSAVAAPSEIGLGQGRRVNSSSSSASPDSPRLAGTPALTLDSFISAAKSRAASEDSPASPPSSHTPSNGPSLSRQLSSTSGPSRPPSTRPIISPRASVAPSTSYLSRRTVSPPTSPRGDVLPSAAQTVASPRPGPAAPVSPPSFYGRRVSGNSTAKSRRNPTRRSTLPTVPPINVLIVEDNPINQTILSMFMKKKGIKYAVAKDGEEAVQKWKAGNFHLVLMDIQLPVKDGIEATREIREMERASNIGTFITTPNHDACSPLSSESNPASPYSHPTSPLLSMPVIIVALTASSLQIDRVTALAAGCNDFLTKPVSLPWLQQKLLEWGSMAYLSGFSRRGLTSSPEPTPSIMAKATPTFTAGLDLKADAISAHLHIDTKAFHHSSSSSTSVPNQFSPAKDGNPALTFSSPSPVPTPQMSSTAVPQVSKQPPQPATLPLEPPVTDLSEVDSRLEELVNHTRRPGISPITPAVEPTLESVVAEGARLVELGRTRAWTSASDSFGQVMHGSGTVSAVGTPMTEDASKEIK